MSFRERIKEKWKKLCTTDNIIDLSVDAFILLADVLTSPILIIVRLFSCSLFFANVRKFVFFDFESIAIILFLLFVIAMGIDGRPEPEPRSSMVMLCLFGMSLAMLLESSRWNGSLSYDLLE